jgi:hypothetical protein
MSECDKTFLVLEIILQNIPGPLFVATGIYNFYYIRQIGFNRVVEFSQLFQSKRRACQLLILLDMFIIIDVFI